jgi:hypothetical protein
LRYHALAADYYRTIAIEGCPSDRALAATERLSGSGLAHRKALHRVPANLREDSRLGRSFPILNHYIFKEVAICVLKRS